MSHDVSKLQLAGASRDLAARDRTGRPVRAAAPRRDAVHPGGAGRASASPGPLPPFRVSWWAAGFPLAASAFAALRFAAAEPGWITDAIALTLLAVVTVAIAGRLARTLVGVSRGELRTLSS